MKWNLSFEIFWNQNWQFILELKNRTTLEINLPNFKLLNEGLKIYFLGFFLLGTGGGQGGCLIFITCRQENCVNLDASCKHTQIHPSMPSWINIHKLHNERFKQLSFLFVQVLGHSCGWEGCAFDWFTALENNLIKLVSRVFSNNIWNQFEWFKTHVWFLL